jgi:cytochrome c-type biogenesis protein CcmH
MVVVMIFWFAAAILTGLTCLALLAALRNRDNTAPDDDRRFYELQIAEIDRQLSLKLIGQKEAVSARAEAARHLLAQDAPSEATEITVTPRKLASLAVLVLVPLITLPVYLRTGSPDVPSFPLGSRPAPSVVEGGMDAMVLKIESHLKKTPDDGRGHELVAPIYMRLSRFDDAVRSYSEAIRILGSSAPRQAGFGEALVYADKGSVSARARAAFMAALEHDPAERSALYFLVISADQEGDIPQAIGWLEKLEASLPEGAVKVEVQERLKSMRMVATNLPISAGQNPAIRAMVEGLASRLATTGGSAEEWARLVRALFVLQEHERANAILAEARNKFKDEPVALRLVEEAAKAQ